MEWSGYILKITQPERRGSRIGIFLEDPAFMHYSLSENNLELTSFLWKRKKKASKIFIIVYSTAGFCNVRWSFLNWWDPAAHSVQLPQTASAYTSLERSSQSLSKLQSWWNSYSLYTALSFHILDLSWHTLSNCFLTFPSCVNRKEFDISLYSVVDGFHFIRMWMNFNHMHYLNEVSSFKPLVLSLTEGFESTKMPASATMG